MWAKIFWKVFSPLNRLVHLFLLSKRVFRVKNWKKLIRFKTTCSAHEKKILFKKFEGTIFFLSLKNIKFQKKVGFTCMPLILKIFLTLYLAYFFGKPIGIPISILIYLENFAYALDYPIFHNMQHYYDVEVIYVISFWNVALKALHYTPGLHSHRIRYKGFVHCNSRVQRYLAS